MHAIASSIEHLSNSSFSCTLLIRREGIDIPLSKHSTPFGPLLRGVLAREPQFF